MKLREYGLILGHKHRAQAPYVQATDETEQRGAKSPKEGRTALSWSKTMEPALTHLQEMLVK